MTSEVERIARVILLTNDAEPFKNYEFTVNIEKVGSFKVSKHDSAYFEYKVYDKGNLRLYDFTNPSFIELKVDELSLLKLPVIIFRSDIPSISRVSESILISG